MMYSHSFSAQIEKYDFGKMCYTVVYVPEETTTKLDFSKSKRLRVEGVIGQEPFAGALMPVRGRWYIMVGRRMLTKLGVQLGDSVQIHFDVVSPDTVDVPRELEYALEANAVAKAAWDALTPGKQRGLAHRVASAKRIETIENRIDEILLELTAN
ncbi:MAG: YdeI/OmpD-associated family protein [Planctomycetota bacterium]